MKKLWLILLSTALLFSLCGMTAFAIVGTASAHVAQGNLPQASCVRYDCDHKDPYAAGCVDHSTYIVRGSTRVSRKHDARVDLLFSPTCGTNWGSVVSMIGPTHLMVSVQRASDGHKETNGSGGDRVTSLYSKMVYAPNQPKIKAQACGGVNTPNTCTGYW